MSTLKHFLDLSDFSSEALREIVDMAREMKEARKGQPKAAPDADAPLAGRILAMIFEKPSTRTRVSFDVGMRQLGGQTLLLNGDDLQLGRGESITDTAKVLSRYVDAIMIRTDKHQKLLELAANASVPVINGLTDDSHPCQLLADILTIEEHRGPIKDQLITFAGDASNNVAASFVHAAAKFDFRLNFACPPELAPSQDIMAWGEANGARVSIHDDAAHAVKGADCLVADTWVSMGDTDAENRHNLLKPYQVDETLMSRAKADANFLHCLPAHRGEEVTAEVIDGARSVVFDEAENRLHAQKAVLKWCLS
ncbi:MAG: ornithine carbamoyltransferase [Alphaproteobacteria bacterium]|nr:MAG: ornithine carbamoyltransferase [Alphaproteobacteria bacterium]